MMSKCVTFTEGVKTKCNGKKNPMRRGKSLLGPLPHYTFGPKALTQPDFARDYSLDPANQKLKWSRPPENVLIIKKIDRETNDSFKLLATWLINEKKLKVYVEPKVISNKAVRSDKDFKEIYEKLKSYKNNPDQSFNTNLIDLIICVGGDGTLLYAASLFQKSMPPVVAFHSGSLGFLTAHNFESYQETISDVLDGNACLMLRSRLRCTVERDVGSPSASPIKQNESREPVGDIANLDLNSNGIAKSQLKQEATSFLVLNELVVNRGVSQYLCNIDLFLEGRRITSVQGDGLIISTPTGSTAYAVAAGASMVHPDVPSIMITPICPHSLSFRPIIVPSGAELKFTVSDNARGAAAVSFDGRSTLEIHKGDYVMIQTSVHPTPCVCKSNPFDDWFDSLSECLHWNSRQSQRKLNPTEE